MILVLLLKSLLKYVKIVPSILNKSYSSMLNISNVHNPFMQLIEKLQARDISLQLIYKFLSKYY